MPPIPRDKSLESTLALATDGYRFIDKRCAHYRSDLFETRLLFEKTVCMQGEAAARVFYDTERFTRQGAIAEPLKATLFGHGGVQELDGDAHRHRKEMFMSLMSPGGIQRLTDLAAEQWNAYAQTWEAKGEIVLFEEVQKLLCWAVCAWAGVPLQEAEVQRRAADFGAMMDGAGSVGLRHWRGRRARRRANRWMEDLITKVRAHELEADKGSALHAVAWHRDQDGELLDRHVASVELQNVLRPTVGVARFIVFAALALHEHPTYRYKLKEGDDEDVERFAQEVRRFYPFFPFLVARVRSDFDWQGYHFQQGQQVLLDLYGTNRDERLWDDPETFRPERFRDRDISAYGLIPQGGGDHRANHRCPGEWIAIALLKGAAGFLTESITYDVPEQDLSIDLARMPAIPKSRFRISNVQQTKN
jgi:fatty-acid peroxygenase